MRERNKLLEGKEYLAKKRARRNKRIMENRAEFYEMYSKAKKIQKNTEKRKIKVFI
jgi:hypothetical protein